VPDWIDEAWSEAAGCLSRAWHPGAVHAPADIVARLVTAALLGGAVAVLYRLSRRGDVTPTMATTLVLLTVLIAMVVQVVGENAAMAFSLVGTLAIIRFRTVVEDTRDTAFVIFAVVAGMGVGAGQMVIAAVGSAVVGATAIAMRPRGPSAPSRAASSEWTLTVRFGLTQGSQAITDMLGKQAESSELVSAGTARQGAAFDLTYHLRLRSGTSIPDLAAEMNRLDGVQNVELRRR
jgi:hypothetical protein